MPHLGAFVPSNYFACIYVSVYKLPSRSGHLFPWPDQVGEMHKLKKLIVGGDPCNHCSPEEKSI